MLIDDNEADNVYHQIMIERSGAVADVVVVESGFEALDYFQRSDAPEVDAASDGASASRRSWLGKRCRRTSMEPSV